MLKVKLYDTEL